MRRRSLSLSWGVAAVFMASAACGGETRTSQPSVTIVEPAEGSVIGGADVRVRLSAAGVEIAPAGTEGPRIAHHHLLLDVEPALPGEAIPAGPSGYIHLGNGDSTFVLADLAPGDHRLIAVLGDGAHVVLDPAAADTVRFTIGGAR